MKPLRTWLARLGVIGALAIVSGCGSGDVPDPSADGDVAQIPDAPPPVLTQPGSTPAPAAAQNVAADDKAAEGKAEDAKAEETTAQAQPAAATPAVAAESASPPASEPSGAGASPDRNSATAEMLAMATKAQPAPAPAGDAAPATPAGGAPAAASGGPGPGGGAMNMGPGMGRMNMGPNAPGAGGMNPNQMQAGMQQQMQAQMQQQGQMQARMQGGPGAPGGGMGPGGGPGMGGNAQAKPADFRTPEGAVQAFLDALKDRDLGRLTEATALRAQNEAVKHNQDMFKRIFDGSLSKAEIDELAATLDGFKISSFNPPKSSGRLDVIVGKRSDTGGWVTIKITTRREKKGWGVCDISRAAELKNPRMGPIRSQPKRS
jgi:hypothetical protein